MLLIFCHILQLPLGSFVLFLWLFCRLFWLLSFHVLLLFSHFLRFFVNFVYFFIVFSWSFWMPSMSLFCCRFSLFFCHFFVTVLFCGLFVAFFVLPCSLFMSLLAVAYLSHFFDIFRIFYPSLSPFFTFCSRPFLLNFFVFYFCSLLYRFLVALFALFLIFVDFLSSILTLFVAFVVNLSSSSLSFVLHFIWRFLALSWLPFRSSHFCGLFCHFRQFPYSSFFLHFVTRWSKFVWWSHH